MKALNQPSLLHKGLFASLLLLMSVLLPGCFLFDDDDPAPEPKHEVPTELARKWTAGQFSMSEFWDYNGSYTGNAFEAGLAFDFKPDGKCEFYLVAGGTSYGCRTETFVYKKGTVQFNEDNQSFTFTPTEGRARGFYKGCASAYQNYDNKTEKKDLKPETYYYTLQPGSNGQTNLIIRFEPQATSYTTFWPANW
ncbi:hypothetical protein AAE02nite_05850 [Adhaeribacter aerolatus]|uniref:Uncharacterized protein n=1 Tax=Adhaeribacter aerolatus TaxID=670289 RepID=A0A512AT83_9BACT|nr:hypothetical protein [Adhaeribacter aerolatus]GEO02921.1 hypothetical protein AAE02nite_05850 [Adhaeribacter aerolatus]